MAAPNPVADRNLLFGILALQMDLISRDDLIAALHAWVLEKSKPLGQILVDLGKLTPPRLQLLETLVGKHLEDHPGDPKQCLAALSSDPLSQVPPFVRQALREVADAEAQASLACASATAEFRAEGTGCYRSAAAAAAAPGLRYHILRPHARGGLGEVFVAEDTELHREVALKEIRKEYADNADSRGRFVLEAEITGGLEHPGIVPVYGLGTYDDGRPFYAMRFIKGDTLREAIQRFHQNRQGDKETRRQGESGAPTSLSPRLRVSLSFTSLAFRELLGRFVDVCNAVAYAHSRGILHRDLKPGNVMLGKYGETLVVDWGLAKPVGRAEGLPEIGEATLRPSSADSDLAPTRLGSAVGTPGFMSPEQAAGRLEQLGPGSDIYSLGATLYAVLTGQPPLAGEMSEILRQAQRGDFPAPRSVKPHVPPALEGVCLKAMAHKPDKRYRTALELAEDIEHWLADEPVSAWPEPLRVRVGRWARQHRPLVSGVAAALLVSFLALGTGVLWYQRDQAQRAAEQAQQEADQVLQEALAESARQQTARDIRLAVQQAAAVRNGLHRVLGTEGGIRTLLNNSARWKGQLREARLHLGRARALLTRAGQGLEPGLARQLQSVQQQLTQDETERELAERLEQIRLERSTLVEEWFDDGLATREYPRAFAAAGLDILEGPLPPLAARIRQSAIREQLVAALDDWAFVAWYSDQKPRHARLLQVSRLADPDPWRDQFRDPEAWKDRQTRKALADKLLGQKIALERLSPQLLDLVGRLLMSTKGDAEGWLRQAQAHHPSDFWLNLSLATVLHQSKRSDAAGYYRAALAVRPKSAVTWANLGLVLLARKDVPAAVDALHKARALDPHFAGAWNGLGLVRRAQKDLPGALGAFRQATKVNPRFAGGWNGLGNVLRAQKDFAGALAAYHKALEIDKRDFRTLTSLGALRHDQKDFAGALAAYHKALLINPEFAAAWNNVGMVLREQKDLPGAMDAFHKALKINPQDAVAWNNLGTALHDRKDLPGAVDAYRKAITFDPQDAAAWDNLGTALREQKDLPGATDAFHKALKIDPQNAAAWNNLGTALREQKNLPGATDAFQKALKIDAQYATAWYNLGIVLHARKDLPRATHAFRKAVAINPQDAAAWNNLGIALRDQQNLPGAVDAFRQALKSEPQLATAWYNLGIALRAQKDRSGAVDAFHNALKSEPEFVLAQGALGEVLLEQGDFAQALQATTRALQLLPVGHPLRGRVQKLLQQCERALQLEQRALVLAEGKSPPADTAELLLLAQFCRRFHRTATSTRLYASAFTGQPAVADDLAKGHRYQAAAAAAWAAAGQGHDATKLPDQDRTELRRQALDWLRADLKRFAQTAANYQAPSGTEKPPASPLEKLARPGVAGTPSEKPGVGDLLLVCDRLQQWQQDPALSSVRDDKELAKLSAEEQKAWGQLWRDVRALDKQARARFTERRLSGSRAVQQQEQRHEVTLQMGKTYVFDLESTTFNPFLRLEDDKGITLVENDDIEPGIILNSRIVFTPKESGTYRLVATSFQAQGTGTYVLRIREFVAKK
jgi:tetratricopeptide (TPR) repeat protein/serine/threonine protein kinase